MPNYTARLEVVSLSFFFLLTLNVACLRAKHLNASKWVRLMSARRTNIQTGIFGSGKVKMQMIHGLFLKLILKKLFKTFKSWRKIFFSWIPKSNKYPNWEYFMAKTETNRHWRALNELHIIGIHYHTFRDRKKAVDIQWSRRWRQGKRGGKRRHSCEISCVLEWEKKKFAATANSVRRSNTQLIAFTCHSEAHTAPVSIFRSRCLTHCVQSLKSCK